MFIMICGIVWKWHDMTKWQMNMNDLRNDNDMKWHDRMINDNLVLAVLATLAAAYRAPPPPHISWVWPRSSLTAFNPLELLRHAYNFTWKCLFPLEIIWTYPDPKYLAFKVSFPLFSPRWCILPRGGPDCSLKLTAWGWWVPYCSIHPSFQIHFSCNRSLWCQQTQPTWTMLVLSELWGSIYDIIKVSVFFPDSTLTHTIWECGNSTEKWKLGLYMNNSFK